MARKNLIGVTLDDTSVDEIARGTPTARPLAGFIAPTVRNTPIGGITKTLGTITQKVERAHDLEKQLASGQTVVEIDPALIDSSFIKDRLSIDSDELSQLTTQIREHGQQVPILVRPHPEAKGRYQVAYGHRRLMATRQLGLKVKAVVRDLTDDQLVVSQGQENNARTNLSFIERALFAVRLEDRQFKRDVIMSALGVDKAALSKMISVVRQVPIDVIEAIGAAPEVGRRRWLEFAGLLSNAEPSELVAALSAGECTSLSSDQRFQLAFDIVTRKPDRPKTPDATRSWSPADNSVSVNLKDNGKTATLTIGAANGPHFASYLADRLDELYADWKLTQEKI